MDHCNGDESWNWLDEDFLLAKGNDIVDIPECLWDNATPEEQFSYILEESTPVRACSNVPYSYNHHGDSSKASQVCKAPSPPSKRRRTLLFDNEEDVGLSSQNQDFSYLKSKETMDSVDVSISNVPWQGSRPEAEDMSSSGLECLDQQLDGWLTDCLNESEMQFSPDDVVSSGSSEGYSEYNPARTRHGSSSASVTQSNAGYVRPVQQNNRPCGNIILKGRNSYMTTPAKSGSSIAYPFTFIKPSVAKGDVTLTDINQRIQTPPKAKEEPNFGTSAITGKPVITKTRIRTTGGSGSITIMRTKG